MEAPKIQALMIKELEQKKLMGMQVNKEDVNTMWKKSETKKTLKCKGLYLTCCILLLSLNTFSQQTNLKQGETITFSNGSFNIVKIESAIETPMQKVKAKNGNHFILISLRVLKVGQSKEFSSVFFVLSDKVSKKYTNPGAWGKIEIMGSLSNFEASEGATVYVRNTDDILNLIFEVSNNIWPNQLLLKYEEINTKTSN